MKRLIAIALLLAMMLTLFAGCNSSATQETEAPTEAVDTAALEAAAEYLKTIYKEVEESTPIDYQRVAAVRVGADSFAVTWSVDVSEDLVKIVESNGMVTIDVSESNPEDVPYVLTATITDANGNTKTLTWNHFLPAAIVGDFSEILDMAYALEDGESLPNSCTLTGIITAINTAWSDDYQNITVTIVMDGCEDKPIMCYRLKGEGAKDLAPGDQITVTGTIKNYKGTIEFDAGCTLDEVVKGVGEVAQAPEDPSQILDEAYALAQGQALPYTATLTGKIISVDTAWSSQYKNITVTIAVEGDDRTVQCYRLKGDGAQDLCKDDVITVTGTIKNYYGTIEFDAGCQLVDVVPGPRTPVEWPDQPEDVSEILDAAYDLVPGENLPYNVRLSGYVTAIASAWSDTYHNISVYMAVPEYPDQPVYCYRMHGSENGADTIEVGDYITVYGSITNYKGTVEYYAGALCEKVVKGDGTLPWAPSEPEDGTVLTLAEAAELGAAQATGAYTSNKYYVTGTIESIASTTWGNMTIKDENGDTLYIYGTYSADGSTRFDKLETQPVVGDTVTLYGVVGNYKGTPQMKNGWITEHIPAGGSGEEGGEEETTPTEPEEDVPAADSALTLEQATALGEAQASNSYTTDKYYVTGTITGFYGSKGTTYGNVYIQDAAGNSFLVYGLYSADGSTRYDKMDYKPQVGDTITAYGVIGNYNGTAQMKNGWMTACTPKDGTALTLSQATALGQAQASNAYTTGKYYVTGTITGFYGSKGTTYGNVYIQDAAGNSFLVYGLYSADGSTRYDKMDYLPQVGDTITAYGVIGNYNGTAQMKNGWMTDLVVAGGSEEEETTPSVDENSSLEDVLAAAAALNPGETLGFSYTITGTISTAYDYSTQYSNITVIMDVLDTTVQCYRLTGTGADQIAVGDTITVTGVLGKNSSGYIRFEQGCTLDSWTDNTPN